MEMNEMKGLIDFRKYFGILGWDGMGENGLKRATRTSFVTSSEFIY